MTNSLLGVDLQDALSDNDAEKPPSAAKLIKWANLAYAEIADTETEITLRLVDESEMIELNSTYRGKAKPTNVLSFPFQDDFDFTSIDGDDTELVPSILGDIVICHSVICREVATQNKTLERHYAHMVTHGVLHLCGYDHLDDASAEEMEALEVRILAHSNIQNPYT